MATSHSLFLFESGKWSDITVSTNNTSHKLHKPIISRVPYFATAIDFKEKAWGTDRLIVMNLDMTGDEGWAADLLLRLIYEYSNENVELSPSQLVAMLPTGNFDELHTLFLLSDYYGARDLHQTCVTAIKDMIRNALIYADGVEVEAAATTNRGVASSENEEADDNQDGDNQDSDDAWGTPHDGGQLARQHVTGLFNILAIIYNADSPPPLGKIREQTISMIAGRIVPLLRYSVFRKLVNDKNCELSQDFVAYSA